MKVGCQKLNDEGQTSKVKTQKSNVKSQRSNVKTQKSNIKSQLLKVECQILNIEGKNTDVAQIPDLTSQELQIVLDLIYTGEAKVDIEEEERFLDIVKQLEIDSFPCQRKKAKLSCQSQPISINDLPPEILLKILSNVSTHDLLQNVALVSQQFYELTKCPEVHLVVSVSERANADRTAMMFLKKARLMTSLTMTHSSSQVVNSFEDDDDDVEFTDVSLVLLVIRQHENLRSILCWDTKHECKMSLRAFLLISKCVWWKKLHKFEVGIDDSNFKEMWGNNETKRQFDDAVKNLGSDGNLSELALSIVNYPIFVPSIHRLVSNPKYNELKSLQIYMEYDDDTAFVEVLKTRKDSLERLTICDKILSTESYLALSQCKKLKYFRNQVSFEDFHVLSKLQNLTTLELDYLSKDFQYNDCLPPNSMPNLTKIKIISKGVQFDNIEEEDEDIAYRNRRIIFLALAKACPNLKSYLIESDYERLSSEFFQEVLEDCTKLEQFRYFLHHENITINDAITHFMLNNLTSLRLLDLKVSLK